MYDINRFKDEVDSNLFRELKDRPREIQDKWLTSFERSRRGYGLSLIMWLFGFLYLYQGKRHLQLVFWLTLGGCGLWWIWDLIRLQYLVENLNRERAELIFNTVGRADPSLNGVGS